jgi:hypothetical protein
VEKIEAVVGTLSTMVKVYVTSALKVEDQYDTTV